MNKKMQKPIQQGWKQALGVAVVSFLILFAYAIIRYNIIKGVSFNQMPLYISNKAIAVTAVVLIGISYLLGPLAHISPKKFVPKLYLRKYFGLCGFGLAALHSFISLLIFSPSYYPKFFNEANKLTLEGELSMAFGIIAFFIFLIESITSLPSVEQKMNEKDWKLVQRTGYLALVLIMMHVLLMGIGTWLKPETWHYMLPMSLISFIIIAYVLLMRLIVIILPQGKIKKKL